MTSTELVRANAAELVGGVDIDYAKVLSHLGLNPKDAAVQALVLVCNQYQLDPVLKQMVLIKDNPYITHKGLLHIAHRSGELNGWGPITQGEDENEWWASVAIYRKGWEFPVTMRGRYPKGGSNKNYGPEMAVTRAECLVLRRMFDVAVPVYEEIDEVMELSAVRSGPKQLATPEQNKAGIAKVRETVAKSTKKFPPKDEAPPLNEGQQALADAVSALPDAFKEDLRGWLDGQELPHYPSKLDGEDLVRVRDYVAQLASEAAAVAEENTQQPLEAS